MLDDVFDGLNLFVDFSAEEASLLASLLNFGSSFVAFDLEIAVLTKDCFLYVEEVPGNNLADPEWVDSQDSWLSHDRVLDFNRQAEVLDVFAPLDDIFYGEEGSLRRKSEIVGD